MELPRAQLKEYGQEYCGLIYSVESLYYSSHPSPLGKPQLVGPNNIKNCYVPRTVKDGRGQVSVFADFHSHPWAPSRMSRRDLEADSLGIIKPEDKPYGFITAIAQESP